MKRKKFNNQTGGYKIDIFVNGNYHSSTDWNKTCKAAKSRFLEKYPKVKPEVVKAFFDYQ